MATPKKPDPKKKAPPRKRPGRKPRPKNQQATSANAIVRAAVKKMAGEYKLLNFTVRQIADAVNEHFGTEGPGTTETPELAAAFWRCHPKGISHSYAHELV